ncbi:acylneuraminate cytidylyltransferase family protein [Prochlorococcus sp. AH-716-I05]|nr:acylneuraminate cytidylyltransferase family protein [Prochlorococcus sp. AH-716-I05]
MKYVSFIPLRSGSKGLKNKNILNLNNKELYMYSVEQALRTTDKCLISTDINSILLKEFNKNVQVFKRSQELSGDEVIMKDVILDLLSKISNKDVNIILMQATSPLRSDQDIESCKRLFNKEKYSMVMSLSIRNKVSTKYGFKKGDDFSPFFDQFLFSNRQSIPEVYGPNGAIYIFKAKDFLKNKNFPSHRIGGYLMPFERSLDIDNIDDFKLAEKQLNKVKY